MIYQMEARIEAEASREEAGDLWTATYILMGLKYTEAVAGQLLRGVRAMQESVTYQAILREGEVRGEARGRAEGEAKGEVRGRAQEARTMLLRLGRKRFGAPDAKTEAAVDAIDDVARLELLAERVLDTESWAELLAG